MDDWTNAPLTFLTYFISILITLSLLVSDFEIINFVYVVPGLFTNTRKERM